MNKDGIVEVAQNGNPKRVVATGTTKIFWRLWDKIK
jgi:hypothetical protein